MAQRQEIDVSTSPDLRRVAEEVRDSGEPIVLRMEDEELAVLIPVDTTARRARRRLTQADYDAVMSTAGSWQGLVDDIDKLKAKLKAARGSDRPSVEL